MNLNADKTLATVHISETMDATTLDALLRKLALLRAEMNPAVPATHKALVESDTKVLREDATALVIRALTGGGFRLWMRHSGHGWLIYNIDQQTGVALKNYVARNTTGETVNLITFPKGRRH